MADKLLEEPKQEWIENLLNLWGAWVFSGLDFERRMNMIAKLMMSASRDFYELGRHCIYGVCGGDSVS